MTPLSEQDYIDAAEDLDVDVPATRRMPPSQFKHGHSTTTRLSPTYVSWMGMKERCRDKSNLRYGGRGITFDLQWLDFRVFLSDMGERPNGMTLDRKDVNQGYSKDNCRWATPREQRQNSRDNVNLTYNGKTQCRDEWAREFNLDPGTLFCRLKAGWPLHEALTCKPLRGKSWKERPKSARN